MNPLLTARNASKLNAQDLAAFFYGNAEKLEKVREIRAQNIILGAAPTFDILEMSRVDQIDHVIRKSVNVYFKNDLKSGNVLDIPKENLFGDSIMKMGSVGSFMVTKLITLMGSEEQKQEWMPQIEMGTIITSYVQTELGHGSDVQNLQTTAVFDVDTREFVFNTPNIAAYKWWPGDLGIFANYILLMAKLVSNGKNYGTLPFFFPIRNPETHELLPGVKVGDIGAKLGYNVKDNGFLCFDNFRVSIDALLSKFYSIDQAGVLTNTGDPRALYSGMMEARYVIIQTDITKLMFGSMIATRYSFKRKQFMDSQGQEIPIIRYQLQREKLLNTISRAIVMSSASQTSEILLRDNAARTSKGDFSSLQELHIVLCCNKSTFTEWATYGLISMIRACGGHGYNQSSGIPLHMNDTFANMILEGENSILLLQVSRYLLKCAKQVSKGKTKGLRGTVQYISKIMEENPTIPASAEALSDIPTLLTVLERASLFMVKTCSMKLMKIIASGVDPKDAWNYHMGSVLVQMARIHAIYSIFKDSVKRI